MSVTLAEGRADGRFTARAGLVANMPALVDDDRRVRATVSVIRTGRHLTEPPVMPAAMYFCARTSRIAAGTADSTDAAITEPQSPTCAPMYW